MPRVLREVELNVPREALFHAITDYEAYPEFLPEVVKAKILSRTEKKARVQFEIEVVKVFNYTLEFEVVSDTQIRWKLEESNFFKENRGIWHIKASGPKTTKVNYELEVEFGFLVPGWIAKKLTEVSLPKMFDNFAGQAKKHMKSDLK
jgi:coenzyme Q-binding protein COQ10